MSRNPSLRLLLAAIVAATLLPSLSLAAPSREAVREADRNGDSRVDRAEFHQRMVDLFYHLDSDRNGALSAGELKIGAAALRTADTDGNGSISLQEYVNDRFKDFRAADKDGDGALDLQEVAAW